MEIYNRTYDNPLNDVGMPKYKELIGDFDIIETIYEDSYSSQRVGKMDNKIYFIEETEVIGRNGGTRFEITELKQITKLLQQ